MRTLTAFVLLTLACASAAQAPAPLVTVKAKAGLVVLKAPPGGEASWDWDERLLPARPDHQTVYVNTAARELIVAAPPGSYRFVCTVWDAGKAPTKQVYYVTFEGGPVPPGPTPIPVPETFESRLRSAHEADKAAGKAKDAEVRFLADIYDQAGPFLKLPQTTGQVYQLIDLAVGQAVTAGDLPLTLKVIDARLQEAHPRAKDAPLTDALRAAFRDAFAQVAKAVRELLGPRPPPVPPGPTPPPGARHILLVRETADSSPALALVIVSLRAGANAQYLKDRGHVLTILDDDAVGPDKQPAPILLKWRPHYQNLKLPALVIADAAGTVLAAESLPEKPSVDKIVEAIKKAGG